MDFYKKSPEDLHGPPRTTASRVDGVASSHSKTPCRDFRAAPEANLALEIKQTLEIFLLLVVSLSIGKRRAIRCLHYQ